MKADSPSDGRKPTIEFGKRLMKCGVFIGEENFKVLVVDKYVTQYRGVPVDEFLCNPSRAISFALGVCKEVGRTADQLPIPFILETLLDHFKKDAY
jgi:hypothetical protein